MVADKIVLCEQDAATPCGCKFSRYIVNPLNFRYTSETINQFHPSDFSAVFVWPKPKSVQLGLNQDCTVAATTRNDHAVSVFQQLSLWKAALSMTTTLFSGKLGSNSCCAHASNTSRLILQSNSPTANSFLSYKAPMALVWLRPCQSYRV